MYVSTMGVRFWMVSKKAFSRSMMRSRSFSTAAFGVAGCAARGQQSKHARRIVFIYGCLSLRSELENDVDDGGGVDSRSVSPFWTKTNFEGCGDRGFV